VRAGRRGRPQPKPAHERTYCAAQGLEVSMKLYVTYISLYARLARIIVIEKALEDRVEIIEAKTRTLGSPCYQINSCARPIWSIMPAGLSRSPEPTQDRCM
jgi:hypothetical protein